MGGPGDETAAGAGRYSRLRASHADRDRVIDRCKAAFVQGRMAKGEFDLRVGQVLTSRTYADLAAVTARLPASPVQVSPVQVSPVQVSPVPPPAPVREPENQPAPMPTDERIVRAWAAVIIPCPIIVAAITLMGGKGSAAVIVLAVILFTCLVAVPVTGLVILHSWSGDDSSSPLAG